MRRIAEKVAIVAQICITLVFVVTTLLYLFNVIPENNALSNNGVLGTLIGILAVVYLLLSGYIVYENFSETENLRQVLLHCDSESATHAGVRVVKRIVQSCAKKVTGVRVRKIKMRLDEKNGIVLTLNLNISTHNVTESVDTLRCLVADAFKNSLGMTFNSINFVINRLKSSYKPDLDKAQKLAKTLTQQRELSADIYEQPFKNNCEACKKADENSDSNTEQEDLDAVENIRDQLHENGQNFDGHDSSK